MILQKILNLINDNGKLHHVSPLVVQIRLEMGLLNEIINLAVRTFRLMTYVNLMTVILLLFEQTKKLVSLLVTLLFSTAGVFP